MKALNDWFTNLVLSLILTASLPSPIPAVSAVSRAVVSRARYNCWIVCTIGIPIWIEFSQGHIQNSTEWWFLLSWVKVSGCNNIIIIQDHVSITLELWRYTRWSKKRPLLRSVSLYQFQTINQINALRKKLKISYADSNVWIFELKIADFFSSFLQK